MTKEEAKKSFSVAVKSTEPVKDDSGTFRAVVTAPTLDRDGDVIETASINIPLDNGERVLAKDLSGIENIDVPLQLDHSPSARDTIGSAIGAKINKDGELEMDFKMSSRDIAQEMLTLLKEGHLKNAFSITFMYDPDDQDDDQKIKNVELIEVSLVYRGSNRNARLISVAKALKEEGEEMAEKKETAEKTITPDTSKDLLEKISALENQVAELQGAVKEETEVKEDETDKTEEVESDESKEVSETEEKEVEETENTTKEENTESKDEEKEEEVNSKSLKVQATKMPQGGKEQVNELDQKQLTVNQFKAFVGKNFKALSDLNQKAIESYKASPVGIMQVTNEADGGAIVPSAQLMKDVFAKVPAYSSIANDLKVITLDSGSSLDYASILTDVVMTEVTEEGGDKAVTKAELGKGNISVREFAGIAILTKKLVRQASMNVYDIIVESFARAIANKRAEMALTDAKSGIAKIEDVKEVTAATETPTYAEIKSLPYQVEASYAQGGKYYISREALAALDSEVDSNKRPQDFVTLNGDGLSGRFKNGFEFVVEESLGGDSGVHAVFGNASRYGFLLRQGVVESETFDTGEVKDGETVHNLLQQNKLAHRVAFYENVGYPIPAAFARLKAND